MGNHAGIPPKIDEKTGQLVIEMFKSGKKLLQICRELGFGRAAVRSCLLRNGMDITETRKCLFDERKKKIVEMARQGNSSEEIAVAIGVSKQGVLYWLRRAGLTIRKSKMAVKKRHDKVRQMVESGLGQVEIAKRLGVSQGCVSRIIKNDRIPYTRKVTLSPGRPVKFSPLKEQILSLLRKGFSLLYISRTLGCTEHLVYQYRHKFKFLNDRSVAIADARLELLDRMLEALGLTYEEACGKYGVPIPADLSEKEEEHKVTEKEGQMKDET